MDMARDAWLARSRAAARMGPAPVATAATATRRPDGAWQVTVTGFHLVALGAPPVVVVGGVALTDVRALGTCLTGRLPSLPAARDVHIDLGAAQVRGPALRLRILPQRRFNPLDWLRGFLRGPGG